MSIDSPESLNKGHSILFYNPWSPRGKIVGLICIDTEIIDRVPQCWVPLWGTGVARCRGTPSNGWCMDGVTLGPELEEDVTDLKKVKIGFFLKIISRPLLPASNTRAGIICFLTASNTRMRKLTPRLTACSKKYARTKKGNSTQVRI